MKKGIMLILKVLLISGTCLGQNSFSIQGKIIDADTKKEIAYANIGIPAEHIGTASQKDGSFKFELSNEFKNETLQISAIGYHTKEVPVSNLIETKDTVLNLSPKIYQMDHVTVTDKKGKSRWIGKKVRPLIGSASYGLRTHPERLGAAFAFRVSWEGNLPIKILHSRMFLMRDRDDPLKIRCGIAKADSLTGLPSNEFYNRRNTTTAAKEKGWFTCDFDEEYLWVDEKEFFVVFEWLSEQDKRIVPMVAIDPFFKSDAYIRHHSFDEWKKPFVDNLIYSIKIEY
ncbi:carboxypeptidase-like regulatory domain-containing protein [Rhodohalobacter sp.]|uniref:carboxypeptidase-like regulatory domain-containing protein n=1 Tax=Rhodohalobacter sp. TaxID=1974210 RepID=UPI002ACD4F2F|nr:carboxypeptidase-like regulatory domain-containing protein [Rhodohalobacter sp.]MDZ7756504.1 carboxypeptidase-like regulatory domain-containing protein [Rhodohalobacter sp.]